MQPPPGIMAITGLKFQIGTHEHTLPLQISGSNCDNRTEVTDAPPEARVNGNVGQVPRCILRLERWERVPRVRVPRQSRGAHQAPGLAPWQGRTVCASPHNR